MSQSATSCCVVTFRYQEEGLTDRAKLTGQLTREGVVTSVTDENGVHHELGSNSFAFINVLDQEDVLRLAQGFGQLALGKQPEVAICSCED
ncbi:type V toxin-antitoxin system endoribonuclease antitoxin GhoS, partial [Serratia marcescens]|uniref:type V toxin-antitoxin system endoribonuclease antitoxin GhoS n=1 Tax=Serratia marcescens TaxID=615 RepID=UPI0009518C70